MANDSPLTPKPYQHFVWQKYLRSWGTNGAVWCLQDGRLFNTGTRSLGVKKNFYKLRELTDFDLQLIPFLLASDKAHPIAQSYHELVLTNVLTPLLLAKQHSQMLQSPQSVELLDAYNTNAIDNFHTNTEAQFDPLLDRLLVEDMEWHADAQHAISFYNFIAMQHMRTRNVKEKTMQRLQTRMGLDISRIWDILALIFAFNVGASLFRDRKRRTLVLVRNDTDIPFITGDQPVVNIDGNGEDPPEALSMHYPVSPRLALYLGEPGLKTFPDRGLTAEDAVWLNDQTVRASHAQVYAAERAHLEPYMS